VGVHKGRHIGSYDGDFVVFLIGMRINQPWKVREWWPVFMAMRPMVKELEERPELGLLNASFGSIYGGPAVVQHWRSFEDLERYARAADNLHLPAWKMFNQRVRDSGSVGIWHETYKVHAGEYETIYGNMPRVGLAAMGEHAPIGSTSRTAATRIGARDDDRAPVAGY
jgi:hypothetical protein